MRPSLRSTLPGAEFESNKLSVHPFAYTHPSIWAFGVYKLATPYVRPSRRRYTASPSFRAYSTRQAYRKARESVAKMTARRTGSTTTYKIREVERHSRIDFVLSRSCEEGAVN